jgi:hypothetical protein
LRVPELTWDAHNHRLHQSVHGCCRVKALIARRENSLGAFEPSRVLSSQIWRTQVAGTSSRFAVFTGYPCHKSACSGRTNLATRTGVLVRASSPNTSGASCGKTPHESKPTAHPSARLVLQHSTSSASGIVHCDLKARRRGFR